jgi:iron complex outermembrane recepter protein
MTRTFLLAAGSAIAMCAAAQPAYAQDGTDEDAAATAGTTAEAQQQGGLAEIVVTAQRREESVQEVPIAISAFDGDELTRRGVTNALEVAQFVPNLVALNNTGLGSANAYFLRGVGNTETIPTFDPPIGTYVDDIYLSRQNANNLSLFDVQRVEVLRGPQGTLFGRNTTGGAVAIFLDQPDFNRIGGYAEVGYGSYDMKLARASVDLPLADTFAAKVSGYWQDDDGYALNTTTGERTNVSDGWGMRIGLRGELANWARWNGSFMHVKTEAANLLNFDCDPANSTNCDGRFVTTGLRSDTSFAGLLTGKKANFGLGNDATMDFVASNLEFDVGDFTLNLITGYVYTTQDFALDFADGRGLPSVNVPRPPVLGYTFGGFSIVNEGEFEQFSQEAKFTGSIGPLELVGGVFYFHEDNFSDFGDIFTLPFAPAPRGLPLVLADRTLINSTDAIAGYIQGDFHVTDTITLTAGLRYTDETKDFSVRDNRPFLGVNAAGVQQCLGTFGPGACISNANLIAPNGVAIPRRQNAKVWTPRFAITFEPTDDLLVFASATRGFKSGGWNARGTAGSELLPFDPEFAWSYDAGFKSELLDNRLRVNLTAFLLEISDLQTPAAFTRANGSVAFITRNFADYQNKGLELEVTAAPFDGLNLFAAAGYQDDKYKLDSNDPAFDSFGVRSTLSQQAICRAQLAAGLVPGGRDPDGAGPAPDNNASSCGVGIVAPDGSIAEPVRTPEFTLAIGGSYRAEFGNGLSLIPAINASWRSESEVSTSGLTLYDQPFTSAAGVTYGGNPFGSGNFVSGSFSDDRWIVNSTLTLASDTGWSLAAECRNCLDEEANESALVNTSYLNPPRTWMLRGKVEF